MEGADCIGRAASSPHVSDDNERQVQNAGTEAVRGRTAGQRVQNGIFADPTMHTTLISVQELMTQRAVSSPQSLLVVDCRFDLAAPAAGERAYQAGHIPQAVYAHLDRDLSAPITPDSGRHPLPPPQRFAATLSAWGLTPRTQVVAYDADNGAYAARLWWLLRWALHDAVAVLDGGFKAWIAGGGEVATAVPRREPTRIQFVPRTELALSTAEVAERVTRSDWRLIDARAAERFAGKVEPIDRVAGHVPGARNHPFPTSLGADSKFLAPEELRARFERSQDGVADDRTIAMCGSGVTACHLLLALEHAGKHGARLYTGSWSEWIRDPQRAIATGPT